MALEAIASTPSADILAFLMYESPSWANNYNPPFKFNHSSSVLHDHCLNLPDHRSINLIMSSQPSLLTPPQACCSVIGQETNNPRQTGLGLGVQVRKKRKRRKPKICKNREEVEKQRMTHIVVERNRRKQMNGHLAVLRSLIPESYAQRGDQASIVGGAIEYVKELEHLLQSLEAQKLFSQLQGGTETRSGATTMTIPATSTPSATGSVPPFSEFFSYPQYTWSQAPNGYNSNTKASTADIEVTLIENHASLRILSKRSSRQVSNLVAGFQVLNLTVLHLNITSLDLLVLYSISAKVEEGCQLTSVDDIADATHHMLRIIDDEADL